YIRLLVEDVSNNLKTVSSQLGQIESNKTINHYNLRALAPFGSRYVDVVFVNPEDSDTGSYKSSFHLVSTAEQRWEFTVKSHDINATMILGWRGLYILTSYTDTQGRQRYQEYRSLSNPLLDSMVLFDVSANKEVEVWEHDEIKEYVFHMEGNKEKIFQWRVKDTSTIRTSVAKSLMPRTITLSQNMQKLEIASLRKDAKARPTREKNQRLKSIDMDEPPHFEVL
ncbi:MAG: hypothetical protein Q9M36_01960, partial [Sulfurovum sp.]|nr:hypothetical protein [Sulfurovum sp.]